jgi:hypothetical protein
MQVRLEKNLYWCPCSTPFRTLQDLDTHALVTHFGSPTPQDESPSSPAPPAQPSPLCPRPVEAMDDFPPMRQHHAIVADGFTSFPAYHASILAQNGFVLHQTRCLVCTTCRMGIHVSNAAAHSMTHGQSNTSAATAELEHVMFSLRNTNLLDIYNSNQAPRPPIDPMLGVCRYQEHLAPPGGGYRCVYPDCNVAFLEKHNASSHTHDGVKANLQPCHVQTIFATPKAHYFPVLPKSDHAPASPSDELTHLQMSLDYADWLSGMTPETVHRGLTWRERSFMLVMTQWDVSLRAILASGQLLKEVDHLRDFPLVGSKTTYYAYVRACYSYLQKDTTASVKDGMDVSFPYRILRIIQ